MNGCIPLFLDIKNCPTNCISTLPKEKLIDFLNDFDKIFSLYNPFKIFKKKHLTLRRFLTFFEFKNRMNNLEAFINENEKVFELKKDLLDFTKKSLTTEVLAKYTLEKFKKT